MVPEIQSRHSTTRGKDLSLLRKQVDYPPGETVLPSEKKDREKISPENSRPRQQTKPVLDSRERSLHQAS
jgi:hypothetical protein